MTKPSAWEGICPAWRPLIVHATDGAPRDLNDARAHGFADAADYAQARRRELAAAMALVGIGEERLVCLGFPDQDAAHDLVALTRAFGAVLAEHAPECVFTHAYEGGHPDHDAVAFAARAAISPASVAGSCRAVADRDAFVSQPRAARACGRVSRRGRTPAFVVDLSAQMRELKRRMMASHDTQRATLAAFGVEQERFRRAAPVDFTQAAEWGRVYYERFDWKCSSAQFVVLARAALAQLRLPPCL